MCCSSFKDIKTAFEARFGSGAPTVVVCAEYDALPGIGHACGHNLIGISGVAAGLALKAMLEESKSSGTVIVMGTPAEEAEGGKISLIEKGGKAKDWSTYHGTLKWFYFSL